MCALPKGFIKNLKLTKPVVGFERRQQLLNDIDNSGTFLPRGVHYEDMDGTFIEMVNSNISVIIDGERVPVIFLTIQKWSEFSKTWQHSDEYKNVKIPFITVVRKPDVQVGTNQAGNWNIPGNRGYTYVKVPTFESGRKGIDVYKIPQPTSVDVTYEIRFFCNRMSEINLFNENLQLLFQSRQHYIYVNGHPMPIIMDNVSDESNTEDFNKRKFYVQKVDVKLLGYILNENDFEVIPTVNRMVVNEVSDNVKKKRISSNITYTVNLLAGSVDTYQIISEFNSTLTNISNEVNIDSLEIYLNNTLVNLPFSVNSGDEIEFVITRVNINEDSSFILNGFK